MSAISFLVILCYENLNHVKIAEPVTYCNNSHIAQGQIKSNFGVTDDLIVKFSHGTASSPLLFSCSSASRALRGTAAGLDVLRMGSIASENKYCLVCRQFPAVCNKHGASHHDGGLFVPAVLFGVDSNLAIFPNNDNDEVRPYNSCLQNE